MARLNVNFPRCKTGGLFLMRALSKSTASGGIAPSTPARLRLRRVTKRTQGQPETQGVEPAQALFNTEWISYRFRFIGRIPDMRPLEQIAMQVENASDTRAKFSWRISVFATDPPKTNQIDLTCPHRCQNHKMFSRRKIKGQTQQLTGLED